jgi:alpha-beta hydrolase superfamily lysophospholipase
MKRRSGYLSLPATVLPAAMICLGLIGCGGGADATLVSTPSQEVSRVVSFTTEDNVEIKGQLFGQSQRGAVLSHMYGADQTSWWEFAQVLAENGYMALTFDFRGYGDSEGEKKVDMIVRDVKAAMSFLREQGASDVFLIGASMGGTASLDVATEERAAGVVSLSSPVKFRGLDLNDKRVRMPVLLMAAETDRSALRSVELMIADGIVDRTAEKVVYTEDDDHGTDILKGENAAAARDRILDFLEAHRP